MSGALVHPIGTPAAAEGLAPAAAAVRALVASGDGAAARERYGDIVRAQQRRATRLAYLYLRDAADADEAVQDAFVKAFVHIGSFNPELPFEVWFTRILINTCLDRLKARSRREKWLSSRTSDAVTDAAARLASSSPSPEAVLLGHERRRRIVAAIDRLPERQRAVFGLTHLDGLTPREVGQAMGLNESTVRVHLFRAVRRLRTLLAAE
jgi:RNA polymerase sigma-70 factor (ECF subfamily)